MRWRCCKPQQDCACVRSQAGWVPTLVQQRARKFRC
jgi:hypothetical protein